MAQIAQHAVVVLLLLFVVSCGVKGDPLPPEKPVEIGRGRPTYKRATEPLRKTDLPPMYDNESDSDDEKDGDEE